ncbi:Uncharacterised protein [Mycobacterium tuberculosis]|nr:Uncharacterised protein [Mycobacterium tuberculosis]COX72087.1 Uncharacterised protein [Mycobacterium tuberculosis]
MVRITVVTSSWGLRWAFTISMLRISCDTPSNA